MHSKQSMIRIVRTADGVRIDHGGKLAGRGAYLHTRRACWERGLKGTLEHSLKTKLSPEERQQLYEFMTSLPDEDSTMNQVE